MENSPKRDERALDCNGDSHVDQETSGESEPTLKVVKLERDSASRLLTRLQAIEAEIGKVMKEVRKMEESQRSDSDIDQGTSGDSKPTPKVDKLEKDFGSDLLARLQAIRAESQKCMKNVREMEEVQERYERKLDKQTRQLSVSHDSRIRSRDIRPGDVTHNHVKGDFAKYFNTSRSFFKPLGIEKEPEKRSELLTNILQVAFLVCQDHTLKLLGDELRCLLEPSPQQVMKDFFDESQVSEEWMYRCEAFSILLSVSEIDPKKQPPEITNLVKQSLEKLEPVQAFMSQSADTVDMLIVKAAKLAWRMVTLVPPTVLGTPNIRVDHWQTVVYGSDESEGSRIIYRRPILFFNAWGDVGVKGEIKLVLDQEDLAQQNKSIPCEAVERKEDVSSHLESGLDADGSKVIAVQASTTPCDQTVVEDIPECEESPSAPVGHDVSQPSEPCEVQSPEMPTQEPVKNDQVSASAQVSKAKAISREKASQSTDCVGTVMPSSDASEAYAKTIETNGDINEDSKIENKGKRNSLAEKLRTERNSKISASMKPGGGKTMSQSGATPEGSTYTNTPIANQPSEVKCGLSTLVLVFMMPIIACFICYFCKSYVT